MPSVIADTVANLSYNVNTYVEHGKTRKIPATFRLPKLQSLHLSNISANTFKVRGYPLLEWLAPIVPGLSDIVCDVKMDRTRAFGIYNLTLFENLRRAKVVGGLANDLEISSDAFARLEHLEIDYYRNERNPYNIMPIIPLQHLRSLVLRSMQQGQLHYLTEVVVAEAHFPMLERVTFDTTFLGSPAEKTLLSKGMMGRGFSLDHEASSDAVLTFRTHVKVSIRASSLPTYCTNGGI